MKRLLFLWLFILLVGCIQTSQQPKPSPAAIVLNAAAISVSPTIQATPSLREVDLCVLAQPGVEEYLAFDKNRYAYEARVNGALYAEMVYANNVLYYHLIPSVAGCEWALLNQQDLNTIKKLGDTSVLPYAELRSQIPASVCTRAPLIEKVFSLPEKACPIREVLLKGMAASKGGG